MKQYNDKQQRVYDLINLIINNETQINLEFADELNDDIYKELEKNIDLLKECPDIIHLFKDCCCYRAKDNNLEFGDTEFKLLVSKIDMQRSFEERYHKHRFVDNERFAKYFLGKINQHFDLNLPEDYLDKKMFRRINTKNCEKIETIGLKCVEEYSKVNNWKFALMDTLTCSMDGIQFKYSISSGNISAFRTNASIFDLENRIEDVILNGTLAQKQEINKISNFENKITQIINEIEIQHNQMIK